MEIGHPIPVLRSFDERKAREFYVDFLGFTVDWEHRLEPDLPLYMQVSRGNLVLHLSEHHGGVSPGGNSPAVAQSTMPISEPRRKPARMRTTSEMRK